ncbi:MAG: DUF2378 family protein [Polyangiaceae bacterium]
MPRFVDPPWESELDVARALSVIAPGSTIAGMFFIAAVEGAQRRGVTLPGARERYLPFGFYPISEFAPLLIAAAERFYPERSLRQGLRAIGQKAPVVFTESVLGKVTLGSASGVRACIEAIAKTYPINIRPSQCTVSEVTPKSCVVSLREVHHFLDSHHVGVFEGTLQHAGAIGSVRIARRSDVAADLLLEWT